MSAKVDPLDLAVAKRARMNEIEHMQAHHAVHVSLHNNPANLEVVRQGRAPAVQPAAGPGDRIAKLEHLSDEELVAAYAHVLEEIGRDRFVGGWICLSARGV